MDFSVQSMASSHNKCFLRLFSVIHSNVILIQATTLSVAVNSHSKALLTIMVSNNFVELKGSVFKKFEINNLFQMSCSGKYCVSKQHLSLLSLCVDIRERFHYVILMLVIILRNFSQSGDMSELYTVKSLMLLFQFHCSSSGSHDSYCSYCDSFGGFCRLCETCIYHKVQ